jgi:hypothetical protein
MVTTRSPWARVLALFTALFAALLLSACDPAANILAAADVTVGIPASFNSELLPEYAAGTNQHPRYEWDFGDGTQATGPQASHTYQEAGEYRVVLRVRDDFLDQWPGFAYETVTTVTVHPNGASSAVNASTGGQVTLPSGANVDIPANALSGNATVSVRADSPTNYSLPAGFAPIGEALVIDAAGATFTQPIDISLPAVSDLPPGKVLAVFSVPQATTAPMAAAARSMAQSASITVGSSLMGVPSQALKGGTINLSAINPRTLILGAVDAASLGGVYAQAASNPRWDQLPGTTDSACSQDADYLPLNPSEGASYVTQLHSRHVACSQFAYPDTLTTVLDKNGQTTLGNIGLKAKWSIYGPSNRLSKRMSLKLSYNYDQTQNASISDVPVPRLKVRALITCTPTNGNIQNPSSVNCGEAQNVITLLDGTVDAEQNFEIPISWDSSTKRIAEFRIDLKLYYSADGTAPTDEDRVFSNPLENVELRCDIGQVWGRESGCVFPQASAVLVLNNPQSLAHIREAITANLNLPGQYTGLVPGSRAVALRSNEPYTGLQRLRVTSLIKANRAKSQKLCTALPTRPPAPGSCPDFTDPDSIEALTPCDCDEYPFASTRQGAALPRSYGEASVKYISSADNRSAGAKLGAFLRKERLIDPFDHERLKPRTLALERPYDPKDAFELDPTTLNMNFVQNLSGYAADFVDQYWIAY